MATVPQSTAEGGTPEPDTHLSPRVAAILREIAQTQYLMDCYRAGLAAKSQRIAQLEAELAELEVLS